MAHAATPTGEEAAWMEKFAEAMSEPSQDEKSFFAKRQSQGQGVGLDPLGNLVYARDKNSG